MPHAQSQVATPTHPLIHPKRLIRLGLPEPRSGDHGPLGESASSLVRSTSFLEKTRSAEGRTVVLRTPSRSPGESASRPHAAPWPPWRPTPPPDRCVLRRGQPPPGESASSLVLAHPTVGGSLRSPPSANALSTECLFRSTREQPHLVDPPPCELLITTSNLC